jgi:hypothetical protein
MDDSTGLEKTRYGVVRATSAATRGMGGVAIRTGANRPLRHLLPMGRHFEQGNGPSSIQAILGFDTGVGSNLCEIVILYQ